MTIFLHYFLKIFAFFLALSVFLTILFFVLFLIGNSPDQEYFKFKDGNSNSSNKVALLHLNGPILNKNFGLSNFNFFSELEAIYVSDFKETIDNLEKENIKGLIISINSPGGTVSATNSVYTILDNFKKNNNVKIFFHTNEILASGGYWFALASDKIFANYGSLVGSIGVRGPDWIYYDNPISYSKGILGDSIETEKGIKIFENIAGKSKDLYNVFRMPTESELKSLRKIVNNIYQNFVLIVSKKRNLENDFIINDLGALIFDATEAKNNFLIDGVANLDNTIQNHIKELELNDYQIIEKKLKSTALLQKIIQSKVLQTNFNKFNRNQICNFLNNSINVIFMHHSKYKEC